MEQLHACLVGGAAKADWQAAVADFTAKHKDAFEFADWKDEHKSAVIDSLVALLQGEDTSVAGKGVVLSALRVITRSRTGLDALYTPKFVDSCQRIMEDKAAPTDIVTAAVLVHVNMAILGRSKFTKLAAERDLHKGFACVLKRENKHLLWNALRVVFILVLEDSICKSLVLDHSLFSECARLLRECTAAKGEKPGEEQACDLTALEEKSDEGNTMRLLVSQVLQVLFACSANSSDKEDEAAAATRLDGALPEAEFRGLIRILGVILGHGVEAHEDLSPLPVLTRRAMGLNDEEKEKPFPRPAKGDFELVHNVWKKVRPAAPEDLPQGQVGMFDLKKDIAHLLIYLSAKAVLKHLEIDGEEVKKQHSEFALFALEGLVEQLHAAARNKDKGTREQTMTPILTCVLKLAEVSPDVRLYLKWVLFGSLAVPGQGAAKGGGGAAKGKVEMKPAGSEHENMDSDDHESLRYIFIKLLTTWGNVRRLVGELLFSVCENDSSEYIRLCGFGSAVGLLADKGLPGFAGIGQKAMSFEDLMALKKMTEDADRECAEQDAREERERQQAAKEGGAVAKAPEKDEENK